MGVLILLIYNLVLCLIVVYSLAQFSLLIRYVYTLWRPDNRVVLTRSIPWDQLPRVTVQLPVFNELYVVERLVDSIVSLRYPLDKLDIQILDDSTDETTALIAQKVAKYRQTGIAIEHLRRPERTGFKAGALAYGLALAKGEYVAIFDADFLPNPDFLLRVMPSFSEPRTSAVQTRWTHLNEDYSVLTRVQAMGLNAHFLVEQNARYSAGLFLIFNGTAGVWRKSTIIDSGGWQSDTLTEDLDLSYRAQLNGWQIIYRGDVCVPAELPITLNAIKSQQYRWMKGPAECARKLLGRVLAAPDVSVVKKIQACFHLLNSFLFVLILTMALLSIPVLWIYHQHPYWSKAFGRLSDLFLMASIMSVFFFGIPFYQDERSRVRASPDRSLSTHFVYWFRFIGLYPIFIVVILGLSLHNSLAVLEGYLGKKTPFVRTPKFNIAADTDSWATNVYLKRTLPKLVFIEIGLAIYFSAGIGLGVYLHEYTMLIFHGLLAVGFGLIVAYSLVHTWISQNITAPQMADPLS